MIEHPILFNTENVKAILDGRKTQTRRILKPQPDLGLDAFDGYSHIEVGRYHPTMIDRNGEQYPADEIFGAYTEDGEWGWKCPYGQVGDRLWVKETYYRNGFWERFLGKWIFHSITKKARYFDNPPDKVLTGFQLTKGWYKRTSLFMFRFDSRITLEITGIRVERLQEISIEDIKKEGAYFDSEFSGANAIMNALTPKLNFIRLWDSLNAKRGYGWETNPWCWVIEFKKVDNG